MAKTDILKYFVKKCFWKVTVRWWGMAYHLTVSDNILLVNCFQKDRNNFHKSGLETRCIWWEYSKVINSPQTRKARFTWFAAAAAKSLQSCPTLWGPIDGSPPGSSIHGILQAKALEWVAMPFSRGSSWPKDRTPGLLVFPAFQQILYLLSHLGSTNYDNTS